jgi:tetratricopeptide (TPR) repeat protein
VLRVVDQQYVFRVRALFALGGLSLIFPHSAASQLQPGWAEQFQQAVLQLRGGQMTTALESFDALWKHNSNDAQLAASIGASLDSTSHHKEARPWYERSLAIRPDFEPALNDLALNYATLGEFSKAQPLLREALVLNPSNAHAAYNLGLVSLRLRDYKGAADAFHAARETGQLVASPDQLALAEANARFRLREYGRTARLLETIRGDRDYRYLLLLGSAQALAGDLPPAIRTLQEAASLAPNDPQVYYRLALVFVLGRLDQEAQNVIAAGLKQIPRSPLLLFAEAVDSENQGKIEAAVASAKQSLDINPHQAQVWALLGRLYTEMGQTDEALKAYEQATVLAADADIGVDRVQLLIRLQRYSEAETDLGILAKHYPNNAGVDRGFGKLYREERKFDLAEKYIRHAILLDPDNAEAHFALAEVLRLTHRLDEAKTELAIFKEKKPAGDAARLLELAAASSSGAEMK